MLPPACAPVGDLFDYQIPPEPAVELSGVPMLPAWLRERRYLSGEYLMQVCPTAFFPQSFLFSA